MAGAPADTARETIRSLQLRGGTRGEVSIKTVLIRTIISAWDTEWRQKGYSTDVGLWSGACVMVWEADGGGAACPESQGPHPGECRGDKADPAGYQWPELGDSPKLSPAPAYCCWPTRGSRLGEAEGERACP